MTDSPALADVGRPRRVPLDGDLAEQPPLPPPTVTYLWRMALPPEGRGRDARTWAEAVMEGAPGPVRAGIVAGWRAVLRLRLAPRPSPAHICGWRIVSATPDRITLAVESGTLTNRIVIDTSGDRVLHATFVRPTSGLGRVLWAVAASVHRLAIPYLLRHALKHLPPA